jgi:hypothetical protein
LGVVAVAIGGMIIPTIASTGHTAGATRSAKIQWEHRQQEIRQAIEKDRGVQDSQ